MKNIKDQHYKKFLNALYGKPSSKPLAEEFPEESFINAPVEVKEHDEKYQLIINFGVQKFSSLYIKINQNLLTVEANPVTKESEYFSRSFLLPENIDEDKITGKWENECLQILLPLGEKTNSGREFKIKVPKEKFIHI